MSNFFKVILAASLSVWVLVACNKGAGGVKVSAPKDGARSAGKATPNAAGAEKAAAEKIAKFPSAEQEKLKRGSAMIREIRPLFRDSARLFNEIWTIIVKDTKLKEKGLKGDSLLNGDKNIFNFIRQALEKRYDSMGLPPLPADDEKAMKECKEGRTALAQTTNANIYSIQYSKDCKPETAVKVALLTKLDGNQGWSVEFNKEIDGIEAKELMGNMVQAKGEISLNAKCILAANSSGRLAKMSCEDLAQDLTKYGYGVVKTWEFSLDTKTMDCGKDGKKTFCATIDIRIIDDNNKEVLVEAHLVDDPTLTTLTTEFISTLSPEMKAAQEAKAAVAAKAKAEAEEKARKEKETKEAEEKAKNEKAAGNSSQGILPVEQNMEHQEQQESEPQVPVEART